MNDAVHFGYLQGGLGNQLFIIAALYREQERLAAMGIPVSVFFSERTQPDGRSSYEKTLLHWLPRKDYLSFHVPPVLWMGYFQDRNLVTPVPRILVQQLTSYYAQYKQHHALPSGGEYVTIGVHIRRTDYLLLSNIYRTLNAEYYCRAIHAAMDTMPGERTWKILLVSDEPHTVVTSVYPVIQATFGAHMVHLQESVPTSTEEGDLRDFFTLASCNVVITANSTFSWWAATLHHLLPQGETAGPRVTCCPGNWFHDRDTPPLQVDVPDGDQWITIPISG